MDAIWGFPESTNHLRIKTFKLHAFGPNFSGTEFQIDAEEMCKHSGYFQAKYAYIALGIAKTDEIANFNCLSVGEINYIGQDVLDVFIEWLALGKIESSHIPSQRKHGYGMHSAFIVSKDSAESIEISDRSFQPLWLLERCYFIGKFLICDGFQNAVMDALTVCLKSFVVEHGGIPWGWIDHLWKRINADPLKPFIHPELCAFLADVVYANISQETLHWVAIQGGLHASLLFKLAGMGLDPTATPTCGRAPWALGVDGTIYHTEERDCRTMKTYLGHGLVHFAP